MATDKRIEVMDALRGCAALSVVWFHLTNGSGLYAGWIKASGSYGWLGVEAFFVISGFVIPYSMYRGHYRGLSDAGTFMLKRLARLEPPYLASLLLTVGLLYASSKTPGFHGPTADISLERVLLHLGYLNVFFARDWFNPVYWTLAVEFQFYLAMILLFPLLAHTHWGRRLGALVVMAALALVIRDIGLVFPYLGLFALGGCAFQVRVGLLRPAMLIPIATALTAVNVIVLGAPAAAVGLVTALAAALVNLPPIRALGFLGAISYSLYLVHVPIGGRVLNLAGRLPEAYHGLALVVSLIASLIAAYIFNRLVELPAQRLSSWISYARGRSQLRSDLPPRPPPTTSSPEDKEPPLVSGLSN